MRKQKSTYYIDKGVDVVIQKIQLHMNESRKASEGRISMGDVVEIAVKQLAKSLNVK